MAFEALHGIADCRLTRRIDDGLLTAMRFLIVMFAALMPVTALADGCEDLWFTRNLIMDRAGYCFGSKLGQAIFDNADCIGKSVKLTSRASRKVAEIQALERQHQCKVNMRSTSLELIDLDLRRKLDDLPIRDEFESACIGWRQGTTPLYAARDVGSTVVGRITDSDFVSFGHVPVDGWAYVTVHAENWAMKSGGWLGAEASEASCRQWAG